MKAASERYRALAVIFALAGILVAPPLPATTAKLGLALYVLVVTYLRVRVGPFLLPALAALIADLVYRRNPALRPFGPPGSMEILQAWLLPLACWVVYLALTCRSLYLRGSIPGAPDSGRLPEDQAATARALGRWIAGAAAIAGGLLVLHLVLVGAARYTQQVLGIALHPEGASRRFLALSLLLILLAWRGAKELAELRRFRSLTPLEARAALLGTTRRLLGRELRLLLRRGRP